MIIIAHRGNLSGPNSCDHDLHKISDAIRDGFYVELDLWCVKNKYYLGHNEPQINISIDDFDHPQVFFHLKNAFIPNLIYADAFAIDQSEFALTLRNRLWCNYGIKVAESIENSIACAPELVGSDDDFLTFVKAQQKTFGICTDYGYLAQSILQK